MGFMGKKQVVATWYLANVHSNAVAWSGLELSGRYDDIVLCSPPVA
jgi:hypothetical protein